MNEGDTCPACNNGVLQIEKNPDEELENDLVCDNCGYVDAD